LIFVLKVHNNGLSLEVTIEKDNTGDLFGALVYKVYVELSFNDSKLEVFDVPTDQLSKLIEKYATSISLKSIMELRENKKAFGNVLKSIGRKKEIVEKDNSLGDLRTISVFTIDKFSNRIIGRTTVELDADIITLLCQDILDRKKNSIVRLHGCNVSFVNQYLKYLMEKLSRDLEKLSKTIKIASFIPFGISVYFTMSASEVIFKFSPLIISMIVTPLLYKYGTKMLLRPLIGHFFKTAFS
jgi:hypothetical protein